MGMAIGDHTWTHPILSSLDDMAVNNELSQAASAVWDATGAPPVAARPPYGAFTPTTPHTDLPFVLWDIDSKDWKNRNAEMTTNRIISAAHPGGVVLMHDIHPSTAQALPKIIEGLQSEGYTLVTIPELLGNNIDTQAAYFSG